MQRSGIRIDKNIENAVREILKSRARSRIYLYLLIQNGAKTEQIIKATGLYPSTVRETLSKMYTERLISRRKLKNGSIGKNPYLYYATAPRIVLQKYVHDIEFKLNKIANLTAPKKNNKQYVHITIHERGGEI